MKIAPGIHVYKTHDGQLDTTTRTYGDIVASANPGDTGSKRNCIVNPTAGSLWKLRFTRNAKIPSNLIIAIDGLSRLRDSRDLPAHLRRIRALIQQPGFDPNERLAVHDQGTALHVAAKAYDVKAGRAEPTGLMYMMLHDANLDSAALDNNKQTALPSCGKGWVPGSNAAIAGKEFEFAFIARQAWQNGV